MPERRGAGALADVRAGFARHGRAMLLYHLFFSVLATAVLLPTASWVLTALLTRSGAPAMTNAEIVGFVLSPWGVLWALAAGTVTLSLVALDEAGMTVIAAGAPRGRYAAATQALWHVGRLVPRILLLTLVRVAAHGALSAPFLAALALLYQFRLGGFDPYYLWTVRPPVIWPFLAAAGPLVALLLAANALLYLRWALAKPAALLEGLDAFAALRRSAALCRGRLGSTALAVLPVAIVALLLPLVATLLVDRTAALVLGIVPHAVGVLIPAMLLIVALAILAAFTATFLGIGATGLVLQAVHRRATGRPLPAPVAAPARGGWLALWAVELVVLVVALTQAGVVLAGFELTDNVRIAAHRGSSLAAPENTLAAIRQAVADGADYVEIDVQQTADGVPVLLHDSDLRRVARLDRPIWQVSAAELASIDVGSWFDPAFTTERVPTLDAAIAAVGDAAKLYIEIKTAREMPGLVDNVVARLQANDAVAGTLVASFDRAVLEAVAALEPRLGRALLVHSSIGQPDRRQHDVLAMRSGAVTPDQIVTARRLGYEIHVWTVNDLTQMSRFIDMGVDAIITDLPAELRQLLDERAALSRGERLVVKLRSWLRF